MPGRVKSISELRKELKAKEKRLARLRAQRKKLAGRIDSIDRQISSLSGEGRGPRKRRAKAARKVGRPRKSKKARRTGKAKKAKKAKRARKTVRGRKRGSGRPLIEFIKDAMKKSGRAMRPVEIASAVVKNGYKTRSKDFYGIVAATLRDKKHFRRVKRGVYTLAG